jgi:hypothetical protein
MAMGARAHVARYRDIYAIGARRGQRSLSPARQLFEALRARRISLHFCAHRVESCACVPAPIPVFCATFIGLVPLGSALTSVT